MCDVKWVESVLFGDVTNNTAICWSMWIAHDVTVNGSSRTNNMCESWTQGFSTLKGYARPIIWTLIESLRKDISAVDSVTLATLPPPPPPYPQEPLNSYRSGWSPCANMLLMKSHYRLPWIRGVNLYGLRVSLTDFCDMHGLMGVRMNEWMNV